MQMQNVIELLMSLPVVDSDTEIRIHGALAIMREKRIDEYETVLDLLREFMFIEDEAEFRIHAVLSALPSRIV
jgi:hypothetical protein